MQTPIIVIDSSGEIDFFLDVDAQGCITPVGGMEPETIMEGEEFTAYDAAGRLLNLSVLKRPVAKQFLFFRYTVPMDYVVAQPAESEHAHADELRSEIINYLTHLGVPEDELRDLSLAELVQRLLQRGSAQ
jgi:hypothetical protein